MIIGQSDNLGWSLSVVNKNDAFMCTPNHESVSHLKKDMFFGQISHFSSLCRCARPACKSEPNFRAFMAYSLLAWLGDLQVYLMIFWASNDLTISEWNFQFQTTVRTRPACKSEPNFRAFNGIIIACLNRRWLILLIFSNGGVPTHACDDEQLF